MKIIGIFRGFPGLGRVVSGVEIIEYFKETYQAETKIFTYLQGEEYITQRGYMIEYPVLIEDYSSIGIIPVSSYGEFIIRQILEFNPDFLIIDGEPLMIQAIKFLLPKIKIATFLNPFDVDNPSNQPSSSLFFNTLFSMADLAIVHGFWKVENHSKNNNLYSINTIIRKEVLSITPTRSKDKICCILGGGTVNSKREFQSKSISIAIKCMLLADFFEDFEFHIFCGSSEIFNEISNEERKANTFLHPNLASCEKYFKDSKLIIARAGRNTISEVFYLEIPAIVIPSGCKFRAIEQKTNAEIVEEMSCNRIINVDENISIADLVIQCKKMLKIDFQESKNWIPGNEQAIELLLNLYNS